MNVKKEKVERIIRECEQHQLRMEDSAIQMAILATNLRRDIQ